MSRTITALVAFSTLVLPVSLACGQQIFSGGGTAPTSTPGTTGKDVPHCQAAPGGSRMRSRKAEDCVAVAAVETAVRTEQQINVSLEVPAAAPKCEATTLTEYSQRNTVARVIGTISFVNCPAGTAGTYNIVARVKDESGEIKPIEFGEAWQTDGAQNVSFNTDYPIGENVELVNVRVRDLKCSCAESAPQAPTETAAPN